MWQPILYASVPESDWDKADNGSTWFISEQDFHDRIQAVNDIYQPIFKDLGINFWFERQWQSKTVNLYADIWENQWNKNWKIIVHGGFARRVQLTKDGFTLALCHEIGHLLGGFPKQDYVKYSTEGQADYYATHVCARKVFGKMVKKSPLLKLGVTVPLCDKSFDTKVEQDICYLTIFAAKSLAETISVIGGERRSPELDSKDNFEIKLTYQLHTPSQCRLDTYIAGLLCEKPWNDKVIPDKKNATCINRPRCWYAP
jgi:hypothetical protein